MGNLPFPVYIHQRYDKYYRTDLRPAKCRSGAANGTRALTTTVSGEEEGPTYRRQRSLGVWLLSAYVVCSWPYRSTGGVVPR